VLKGALTLVMATALVLGAPVQAFLLSERIEIPSLGLAVTMPNGWRHAMPEEHRENLRRITEDQAVQDFLLRHSSLPAVAFAKYPEPFQGLNPSFRVTVRPIGSMRGRLPVDILNAVLPAMRGMLGEIEIEQPPSSVSVSGHSAAYARILYALNVSGENYPAVSEIWIVPRDTNIYIIGAGWGRDEALPTRNEIRAMLDSLVVR
jgi:hypothetical protein